MHSSLLLGAIMAVGCVAVPLADLKVIPVMDVVTVTVTGDQPHPTSTPPAAANQPGGFLEPQAAPAPAPQAPPQAPSSGTSTGGSEGSIVLGGVDIIPIVNKYRMMFDVGNLTANPLLTQNAEMVGQLGGGVHEVHHLIPGMAMAQVITPSPITVPSGIDNPYNWSAFEFAMLAWECEIPSEPIAEFCNIMQQFMHMSYGGDTGHATILRSPDYTGISCAFTQNQNPPTSPWQGLMVCNLSP